MEGIREAGWIVMISANGQGRDSKEGILVNQGGEILTEAVKMSLLQDHRHFRADSSSTPVFLQH